MDRKRFSVALKPPTTYLTCTGDPTTQSMITLYVCANIDNKYSAVAHLYCSTKPYVFPQIVLIPPNNIFLFYNSLVMRLLWAGVVA